MDLAKFGLRHERLVVFVVAVLTVLGIYAYLTIPAGIFPIMTFSRIDVVADLGNLPPDQVRVAVAVPLERAFQGLPAATRVLTTSSQGNAEFIVEFDPRTPVQADLTYVDQAIAQNRSLLPPDTDIQTNIINPNSEPIASYALTSTQHVADAAARVRATSHASALLRHARPRAGHGRRRTRSESITSSSIPRRWRNTA